MSSEIAATKFSVPLFIGTCIALLLGVYLRCTSLEDISRTPDERYYLAYSQRLATDGVREGLRNNIIKHQHKPEDWIYAPPSRIGQLVLNYLVYRLIGGDPMRAGVLVSIGASILAMLLGSLAVRFYFGAYPAFLVSMLAAISPLSLSVAQRNWNESLLEFLMLPLVLSGVEIARRQRFHFASAAIFFFAAVLALTIKESALLMIGFALVVPFFAFSRAREWRKTIMTMFLAATSVLAGVGILAFASGGLDTLIAVYRNTNTALYTNDYVILYQDGPVSDFVGLFQRLSPGSAILVIVGLLLYIADLYMNRTNEISAQERFCYRTYHLIWSFMILLPFALVIPPYYVNFRYMSPLYSLIPLLAALPFSAFLPRFSRSILHARLVIGATMLVFLLCANLDFSRSTALMASCADLNLLFLKKCLGF